MREVTGIGGMDKNVSWRDQLRHLLQQFGRDLVIGTLTEDVEGLSTRDAVVLADLAEQDDGKVWSAKARPIAFINRLH